MLAACCHHAGRRRSDRKRFLQHEPARIDDVASPYGRGISQIRPFNPTWTDPVKAWSMINSSLSLLECKVARLGNTWTSVILTVFPRRSTSQISDH